jgi:CheY-like chemotaxis protein
VEADPAYNTRVSERPLRVVGDRRRLARGGRRPGDRAGFTPMIVVIDDDTGRREISEAILAKLRFAVAPFASAEQAISAMRGLLPEAVVAREDAAAAIREHLSSDRSGRTIPLLAVTDDLASPEALVEALRKLLRANS